MNPELPEDWIEEALRSRAAMTAPPDFARTVVRRVAARAPFSQTSLFVMEHGPRVGLTAAILGLGLTVDVNRLGLLLQRLPGPSPIVLAIVGVCLTLLWLSVAADETI